MALDTKQKRGSVLGLSLPFRNWQSEPAGEFDVGGRLSLLRLFAGLAAEGGEAEGPSPVFTFRFAPPDRAVAFETPPKALRFQRARNTLEGGRQ